METVRLCSTCGVLPRTSYRSTCKACFAEYKRQYRIIASMRQHRTGLEAMRRQVIEHFASMGAARMDGLTVAVIVRGIGPGREP